MKTEEFIQDQWIELGDENLEKLFINKNNFPTKERALLQSTIIKDKLQKINSSKKINPSTKYFIILLRHQGGDTPNEKDLDTEYQLYLHLNRNIDAREASHLILAFQTKQAYEETLKFIRSHKLFRGVSFARKSAIKAA